MTAKVVITDGCGSGAKAKVSCIGQQVIGAYAYDLTEFNELGTAGAAVNFYRPRVSEQFVITGLIAAGNLSIAANALATVVIYEASTDIETTEDRVLLQVGVTRLQTYSIAPLNILVNTGKFVNAKTDDDDVFLTIMGYYIPTFI